MCAKYADTSKVRFLPGDFPGATPRQAHVIAERGAQTLICWISYPSTGRRQEVPTFQVFTDPAAASRWPR